jgi:hypothetical protein
MRMPDSLPTGAFTCEIRMRRIRPPQVATERHGDVTYMVARGYELAYETTLQFGGGERLAVKARLFGELNRQLVFRDTAGKPVRTSGWVHGRVEIADAEGQVLFRGPYYDSRVIQTLAGDEELPRTGQRIVHWENGFGEGPYVGHAFSLGVEFVWDDPVNRGTGRGEIE